MVRVAGSSPGAFASAPRRTIGYPSLKVLPPSSEVMTADKRLKLEKELTAARDRQAAAVEAREREPQTVQQAIRRFDNEKWRGSIGPRSFLLLRTSVCQR
jgi:hypothetical protein